MVTKKLPYSYFFWIGLSTVLSFALINSLTIVDGVLTSFLSTSFLYMTVAKYTCRIEIKGNFIYVEYLFPLVLLKRKIEIKKDTLLEYELGYFYYFHDEHNLAPIQFLYPHDRIIFYELINGRKFKYNHLNINVSYSEMKKVRRQLAENVDILNSNG